MQWSFPSAGTKKRNQVVAIDLGALATKAVCLQRKDGGYELARYVIHDAPLSDKSPTEEQLADHLKAVIEALGVKPKYLVLAVGSSDSLLRLTEMPMMPVTEMRQLLKLNSKTYFQQEFPDFTFDCHILPPAAAKPNAEGGKVGAKCRVLVGGAKRSLIDTFSAAAKTAGLVVNQVVPGLAGSVNAFELAMPEPFANEAVALVDLGYRSSTISILLQGELILSRVVGMGGDHLTAGLAEALSIPHAEADGLKLSMSEEIQPMLLSLLTPLGRELRASIDFFEHQHDRAVSGVFVSGATSRSSFVVETLQTEMMVPCQRWNPLAPLQVGVPVEASADLEELQSQLDVAAGAGIAALS
jgi:type IV pilus assembly protein PilM